MNPYYELEELADQLRAGDRRALDLILTKARAYMDSDMVTDVRPHGLTQAETEVLALLKKRQGQVVRREALACACAPIGRDPSHQVVDIHVMRIRRKLKDLNYRIETIWGIGYRLAA